MVVSPTQASSNACYQVKLMAGNLVFPAFFRDAACPGDKFSPFAEDCLLMVGVLIRHPERKRRVFFGCTQKSLIPLQILLRSRM